MRCKATTKLGHRCKHSARPESEYCALHAELNGATARVQTAQVERVASEEAAPFDESSFAAIADAMSAMAAQMEADEQKGGGSKSAPKRSTSGLSQAVYSAAYCLGFGAALPLYLGLGLLPQDSSAARGLRDGAKDAKTKADQIRRGK